MTDQTDPRLGVLRSHAFPVSTIGPDGKDHDIECVTLSTAEHVVTADRAAGVVRVAVSDLLSGLRKGNVVCGDWYNKALDDVREALRNPTDEQVGGFVGIVSRHTVTWNGAYRCPTCGPLMFEGAQDAVFHPFLMALAALAGGDE